MSSKSSKSKIPENKEARERRLAQKTAQLNAALAKNKPLTDDEKKELKRQRCGWCHEWRVTCGGKCGGQRSERGDAVQGPSHVQYRRLPYKSCQRFAIIFVDSRSSRRVSLLLHCRRCQRTPPHVDENVGHKVIALQQEVSELEESLEHDQLLESEGALFGSHHESFNKLVEKAKGCVTEHLLSQLFTVHSCDMQL